MILNSSPRLKRYLLIGLLIAVLIFILYYFNSQIWDQLVKLYNSLHDQPQLKRLISYFGPYSPLAYILMQMLQVIIAPIPGGAVEFIGGYLFGVKAGFIYSMIGLLLGSWAAFAIARVFEKLAVEKFVSPQTMKKFIIIGRGSDPQFLLFDPVSRRMPAATSRSDPMHRDFLFIATVGEFLTLLACSGGKAFDHQYKTLILLGISALIILVFASIMIKFTMIKK
jgi:uncharacterized membrane protein YdjX (TVP38/TMEM64 family)